MVDMTYIRPFEQLSAADVGLAGGKGANLGELTQAGFPVPPGFVLTTAAYRHFVQANNLQEAITAVLPQAALHDPAELARAATVIARHFAAGRVPAEIADDLCRAYLALGGGLVAVRSSATAEDLPTASFAGQQETFLNVRGAEAVLEATRRCWASLWTARAMAYRARQGIPPDSVSLAVVIQQMVAAEAAGVLFTAHPVTGDPNEMVINAVRGSGEALVGGQVTPEEIVVGWPTWAVRRRDSPAGRVLTDAQAVELARLGERIESHYGRPQDIEWAWADGRFHVLQARPITTPVQPRL
jgi:phosphoenolpyruvate synthase/pyruvate phosphate dikinase